MITTRFGAEFLVRTPRDAFAQGGLDDMRLEIELGRRSLAAWRGRRVLRAILPGGLGAWIADREARRANRETLTLLGRMSPHLLDDIGVRDFVVPAEDMVPIDRRG